MKTYTKTAISKLVTRFDNELKSLLMEDLKSFRESATNFQQATNRLLHNNS